MKKLFLLPLIAILFACNKPAKITRAIPAVSFKYDGIYTETISAPSMKQYQKYIAPDGSVFGYMFVAPMESSSLQFNIRSGSLSAGQSYCKTNTIGYSLYESYSHNGLEIEMLWNAGAHYVADSNFTFTITGIAGYECEGTFSGMMISASPADTITITSGQFNHIPIN